LFSYPLFSYLRGKITPNPVIPDSQFQPPVSIIMACYNEERYIEEKMRTLLSPENHIPGSELIVISTGSTDNTNSILRQFTGMKNVHIVFGDRMTKIQGLNLIVPKARHDILIFTDCRQYMKQGSIRQLVSYLADETVGTVSCTMMDTRESSTFFRKLYLWLARTDMTYGSSLNLYGALYAQRKSIFRPIPEHLLFDDFFVAASTLAQRKRLVQAPQAVLYDVPFTTYYNEERIRRLARGLLLFLFNNGGLIRKIPFAQRFRLIIYKYLKLLLPIFLVAGLGCILLLLPLKSTIKLLVPLLGFGILLLLFQSSRIHLILLLRIHWYFFAAVYGYIFRKQRSRHWDPLLARRRRFFPGNNSVIPGNNSTD
jgi:cellulose synthase/poly-beta-1,6-N-acetylglucosamine synthase-like glycosyltransferase